MSPRPSETCCIEARFPDAASAERAGAEAWEAGAEGIEERSLEEGCTLLLLYAKPAAVARVRAAVERVAGARVSEPAPVTDTDWSEAWRDGLEPIRIGTRLVVRPSWIDPGSAPAERELVMDPGQAFGTGAHVSTRLILDEVEALSRSGREGLGSGARVLDVGTGSGILALAALALGANTAVGFDLDPESGRAAGHWARINGLADRFGAFVGPVEALAIPPGGGHFDWVLANLLKREMLPLRAAIAARTRPGGQVILSGLLAPEEREVVAAFEAVGLQRVGARNARDPNGDDWVCLRMLRS